MNGSDFEELDHTADVALRARGSDFSTLLRNAARGLLWLMHGPTTEQSEFPSGFRNIELEAPAPDELLRDWLSELIFLVAAERIVPFDFEILDSDGTKLLARVAVLPLSDEMVSQMSEIKAVTWHGLRVEHDGGEWVAEVVFDT